MGTRGLSFQFCTIVCVLFVPHSDLQSNLDTCVDEKIKFLENAQRTEAPLPPEDAALETVLPPAPGVPFAIQVCTRVAACLCGMS